MPTIFLVPQASICSLRSEANYTQVRAMLICLCPGTNRFPNRSALSAVVIVQLLFTSRVKERNAVPVPTVQPPTYLDVVLYYTWRAVSWNAETANFCAAAACSGIKGRR